METIKINKKHNRMWTDKYYPHDLSEIIGNINIIEYIKHWLLSFNENKKKIMLERMEKMESKIKSKPKNSKKNTSDDTETKGQGKKAQGGETAASKREKKQNNSGCLLVTGDHGVGKTCTILAILKDMNYDVQTLDFSRIQKMENIKDFINRIISPNDILSMVQNKKQKKTVVVVDELESIISKIEMGCIMTLIESNELKLRFPIIFISNNQHSKFINEIKKKSMLLQLRRPESNTMMILLNKIKNMEKMKIENNVLAKIINHAQYDYRRLITIMEDLHYLYDGLVITNEIFHKYAYLSKKKDVDYDLFRASGEILFNYVGVNDTMRYYETDKVNLPLMMQENYVKSILNFSSHLQDNEIFNLTHLISDSLSRGDIIENYIYNHQNWSIHETHGFFSCINPSFHLNNKLEPDEFTHNRIFDLKFPNDLNKTSIKKINKKNISRVNEYLKNMNISDYVYINHLVKKMIKDGKIADCAKLFNGYNLTLDNIDKLLKVDKIEADKISLTSKQKKEFVKNLI